MGGNPSKDQVNAPQQVQTKSKSYNPDAQIRDWPTPQMRKNISQLHQNDKQQPPAGFPTSDQFNNSIEEDALRNPTNRLSYYQRAGSLSRRQNVLPLMTQRVLSTNLVLCKVQINQSKADRHTNNSSDQNLTENRKQFSPVSVKAHRDSKQSEFSPQHTQIEVVQKTSFNQTIDRGKRENNSKSSIKTKLPTFQKLGSREFDRKSALGNQSKLSTRPQLSSAHSKRSYLQKATNQVLDQSSISSTINDQGVTQKLAMSTISHQHLKQKLYSSPKAKGRDDLRKSSTFEFPEDHKQLSTSRYIGNSSKFKSDYLAGGTTRASHSKLYSLRRDSSNARLDTRETMAFEYDLKMKSSQKYSRHKTLSKYSQHKVGLPQLRSVDMTNPQSNQIAPSDKTPKYAEPVQDYESVQAINLIKEFKEISLPMNVVLLILQFNFNEYPKMQLISASWHTVINDTLDEYANKIENSFNLASSKALNFIKSYNSATPITFCNQKGMRVDRIFQCEIADNSALLNHTLMIACDYSYIKIANPKQLIPNQRYRTEYMFDVVKRGKQRVTWIHLSDELPPYSQNEIQMSPGDIIEFAVCLYNMNGIVDLDKFSWENIELFKIQKNERDPLIYNRDLKILKHKNDRKTKVHCNLNRICEVEDAVPEWITVGKEFRDQPRIPISVQKFQNRFNVLSVQFNELDQHYNKIVLQCKRRGLVESTVFGEEIMVHVKTEDESITNEIKKRGVMFDRNKGKDKLQLRIGDILVVYNSIRIPEALQPEIVFADSTYNTKQTSQYNTNQTANRDDESNTHTNS